ncbi:hypothetical protein JW921_04175, partial [Candidatus Fermentibacterales bacterium]|nr:hypothetical protein [Candidatus Fermentibacterales bacterium]
SVLEGGRADWLPPLSMPMVWLDPGESRVAAERWSIPDLLPYAIVLGSDRSVVSRLAGGRSGEELALQLLALSSDPLFSDHPADTSGTPPDHPPAQWLHVTVVGARDHPVTASLLETARELAGEEHVELLDPSLPGDLAVLDSLRLPVMDRPYARTCLGSACGRPAFSAEELISVAAGLSGL